MNLRLHSCSPPEILVLTINMTPRHPIFRVSPHFLKRLSIGIAAPRKFARLNMVISP